MTDVFLNRGFSYSALHTTGVESRSQVIELMVWQNTVKFMSYPLQAVEGEAIALFYIRSEHRRNRYLLELYFAVFPFTVVCHDKSFIQKRANGKDLPAPWQHDKLTPLEREFVIYSLV